MTLLRTYSALKKLKKLKVMKETKWEALQLALPAQVQE